MIVDAKLGWICLAISIVCFGFFATPYKLNSVQKAKVDPILIQFFISIPIFIFGCVELIVFPFDFSWSGVIGAAIWIPSSLLSIVGINLIGVGIAQGLWSGLSVVINFLWGVLFFDQKTKNLPLSITGIVMLIMGCFILALSDIDFAEVVRSLIKKQKEKNSERTKLINTKVRKKKKQTREWSKKILGLVVVFVQSLFNGSMNVPARFDTYNELYLFEFGIGTIFLTPIVFSIYIIIKTLIMDEKVIINKKQVSVGIVPALIAGTFWVIGNFGQVFAVQSPLGMVIGAPLVQSSMVIAGILGMVFFGEFKGFIRKIQFFFATIILIIPGSILLAIFGSSS